MRTDIFKHEAEQCRREAETTYSGRPEGPFLLSLACAFEELARGSLRARSDTDEAANR